MQWENSKTVTGSGSQTTAVLGAVGMEVQYKL